MGKKVGVGKKRGAKCLAAILSMSSGQEEIRSMRQDPWTIALWDRMALTYM